MKKRKLHKDIDTITNEREKIVKGYEKRIYEYIGDISLIDCRNPLPEQLCE